MRKIWLAIFLIGISTTRAYAASPFRDFEYKDKGRRDPCVPLTGKSPEEGASLSSGAFSVEGIILDPGKESLAVVNGKVVREGDSVDGYRVEKIEKNSVIMAKGDQALTLRLSGQPKANSTQDLKASSDKSI